VPLIGFAGAPFTVASYLVEGRPSRTYGRTKALLHGDPELWHALLDRLADQAIASLRAQVGAGASAVQVFDSWAGALSPRDYERAVLPHSRKLFAGVADLGVPRIHFGVDIKAGVGPVVEHPFRTAADLDRLRPLEPETDVPFVLETVRLLVKELDVPLIGFAGAPFTVASYVIEGGPSRDFLHTKRLMHEEPQAWRQLMSILADATGRYLAGQIAAGADVVQVFDSWVGALSVADYEEFVAPYSARILGALDVPTIHFGTGTTHLLGAMSDAGGDVTGLDWRVPLDAGWALVGEERGVQGNLDPVLLLGPWERIEAGTRDVLDRAGGRPGHIFNLGHGVLPETEPSVLSRLRELVHELTTEVRV